MKNQTTRRILAILLALVLTLGLLPTSAFAARVVDDEVQTTAPVESTGNGQAALAWSRSVSIKQTYGSTRRKDAGSVNIETDFSGNYVMKSPTTYASTPSGYTFSHFLVSCGGNGGVGPAGNQLRKGVGDTWSYISGTCEIEIVYTGGSGGSGSGSGSGGNYSSGASGSHSVSCTFTVLYVDSSFNIGYNYGDSYSTTFNCQYNNCSTTGAYSNHCIALSDIGAARSHVSVDSGYSIVGWTKSASANPSMSTTWTGTGYGSGGTTLQKNGTIYLVAKRANSSYTITYHANGGSGAPSSTSTESNTNSTKYATLSNTEPTRSNYKFLGWSTDPGATSATYAKNTRYGFGSDTDLYAVWQKIENVTLTYYDRGSVYATDTQPKNTQVTIQDCTSTHKGYTFLGWNSDPNATTADWSAGEKMNLTADSTLYAVWQSNAPQASYTVEWIDLNGDPLKAPETRKGTVGETVSATTEDKTISGYRYVGTYLPDSRYPAYGKNKESDTLAASGTKLTLVFYKSLNYAGPVTLVKNFVGLDSVNDIPANYTVKVWTGTDSGTPLNTFTVSDATTTENNGVITCTWTIPQVRTAYGWSGNSNNEYHYGGSRMVIKEENYTVNGMDVTPTATAGDQEHVTSVDVRKYTSSAQINFNISGDHPENFTTDTWTITNTYEPKPALILTKTADKESYKSGETITYTITLKNNSDVPVGHVRIYEDLDKAFKNYSNYIIEATPSKGSWGQIDNTGNNGYLRYSWSVGDSINTIAPQEEVTLTLKVKAAKVAEDDTPVNNTVSVVSYALVGDTTTWVSNAEEVAKTTQGAEIDVLVSPVDDPLVLRKTASTDTVNVGDTVEYTIHIENPAANTWKLEDLTVEDPLPEGFEFVSAKVEGKEPGGLWGNGEDRTWSTSVTPTAEGVYEITSVFFDLYPGYAADLTITARATTAGEWTNTATVKKNADDPGTEVSSDPVTVTSQEKATVTWFDENGTTILDGPTEFTKGGTEPSYSKTRPTKAEDENYTYEFKEWVEMDDSTEDAVKYKATYTATPKTPVTPITPELEITKTAVVTGTVHPGEEVRYLITVTNKGSTEVKNVVITDVLDQNLVFTKAEGTGGKIWNTAPAEGKYDFGEHVLGSKDTNTSMLMLTIYATVADDATGTIPNVATVDCPNMPANKPSDDADITVGPATTNGTVTVKYVTDDETPVELGSVQYTAVVGTAYDHSVDNDGTAVPETGSATAKSPKTVAKDGVTYAFDAVATTSALTGEVSDGLEITVVYAADAKGTPGTDDAGEPTDEPDGIPDKYQVKVTFHVVNGYWTEGTDNNTDVVTYLEKYAEGVMAADGVATLGDSIPAVGEKPVADYRAGSWDVTPAETTEIREDSEYTYTYVVIGTHTVTWLDEDGTQIERKTFRDGENVPAQDFADPTKAADDDYTYEFAGWTRAEENGDITYTATYDATARHKVTWLDEDGTTVLAGPTPFALDGTEPTTDVVPTKDEDADNTYTFAAWVDRQVDDQGNVTYKASYTATAKYTVTWKDGDDVIITADDKVKDVDDVPEFPGELPTAPEGKEFDKWGDPVVDDETHTITVPIVWKDKDTLTVKWVDEDGKELDSKTFFKGEEEPAKTIDNPTKASDATYNYSFKEWIKTTDDNGNITYTASYDATRKSTGGGGGGNRPVNPPEEDLDDPDVPLADLPMLNQTDHFAYIIGKPDGMVHPLGNITRAEVVTIFFRIMTEEARSENWKETNEFSDVTEGMWYNHAVSTAVNAGLIKGMPDGTFGGDRNITRAEFATIAARFLDTASQPAETFTDIEGHWAEADINRATVAGWIKGVGDGKFNPDAYITRAEVMTLVNRMLNRKFDETNTLADMVVWPDNTDKDIWYYGDVQEATNDHEYERKAGTLTETWTKITEPRDWSELEK